MEVVALEFCTNGIEHPGEMSSKPDAFPHNIFAIQISDYFGIYLPVCLRLQD